MNVPVLKSNWYRLLIKELRDCSHLKEAAGHEAEESKYSVARLRGPVSLQHCITCQLQGTKL